MIALHRQLWTAMDKLENQCNGTGNYPLNVVDSAALEHNHRARLIRLNDQQNRLFGAENKACLEFLEHGEPQSGRSWSIRCTRML